MNVVEALTAARARIEDPKNWVKGMRYARRAKSGKVTEVKELKKANCFCAIGSVGATLRATRADAFDDKGEAVEFLYFATRGDVRLFNRASKYLNAAAEQVAAEERIEKKAGKYEWDEATQSYIRKIWAFVLNDHTDHATVLRVFDRAIKNAKRRHINGGK